MTGFFFAGASGLAVGSGAGFTAAFSGAFTGAEGATTGGLALCVSCCGALGLGCCALALAFPDGRMLEAEGTVEGRLLMAEKGDGGFGYDPLFFLPELAKTFAELTLAEKNAISHRGQALQRLLETLRSQSGT